MMLMPAKPPPALADGDLRRTASYGVDLAAQALADQAVEAGAREQPEAAGDGHGAGQRVQRHADAHAALHDRQGKAHAFDGQRWELAESQSRT